jgi:hypothetical protein
LVDTFTFDENYLVQSNLKNLIIGKLGNDFDGSTKFYSQICFKGVEYRPRYYLSIFSEEIMFYLIHEIVIVECKQLLFFCQNVQDVKYIDHIIAYEFDPTNLGSFALLTTEQIIGPPIHLIVLWRLVWSLFLNLQIFDFLPFHFVYYYMKVIVVKFGHDYSTTSRVTKGLKNSKIGLICQFLSLI